MSMRSAPSVACLSLIAALCACSGKPPAPIADQATLRSPAAGEVVGFVGSYGNHAWRGIPYAKPPVGDLRWRAPQPLPPWSKTREALAPGTECTQYTSVFSGSKPGEGGKPTGSEDCLYLDVFAPAFAPNQVPQGDARLPVMFWIHGGGNTIGNSGFYDGGHLAQSRDVVVVAINYRLGPFGWFRHRSLRGEGTSAADRSGDFGNLDMIRALEWVRDNISAFGGDPNNVTVFGESAGGADTVSLVLSPRAHGLFERAIVESGGLDSVSPEYAEDFKDDPVPGSEVSSNEVLAKLLVRDGTAADRAAARQWIETRDDDEIAAYLRGKPAFDILAAYQEGGPEAGVSGGMYQVPDMIRDGYVLPRQPAMGRIARGAYNEVPIIFGTNRDENKLFMAFDPSFVNVRFGLFPVPKDQDFYDASADARARAWKARAVDAPAAEARSVQGPSVYAYRFDWDEEPSIPFLVNGPATIGAGHAMEIPFVFGHWDLGPQSDQLFVFWNASGRKALSKQMMSYWTEFAYTGSPGRGRDGELPQWTPWSDGGNDAPRYMVLDTADGGGLRMSSDTWTMKRVVASVLDDKRLHDPRDRCRVLASLARSDDIGPEEYASAGGGACRSYALEGYPWNDVAADGSSSQ